MTLISSRRCTSTLCRPSKEMHEDPNAPALCLDQGDTRGPPGQLKEMDENPVQFKEKHKDPVQFKEMHIDPVQFKELRDAQEPCLVQGRCTKTIFSSKEMHEKPVQFKEMHKNPVQFKKMHENPIQFKDSLV